MSKTVSSSMLPPVRLSSQDEFALRQLAAQLQREIVSQYEEFLFQAKRGVDAKRWKPARSDDGLHAYYERKSALKLDAATASASSALPQAALAAKFKLRRVLLTGVRAGTLDDIMFGSSFQDSASQQAWWASQNEYMEESAVLATIDGPTVKDPFKFMGVSWFLRKYPLPGLLVKRRDVLALVDVHLSKLSNGERIGVSIAHSIQHRDLGELSELGVVRSTSSLLRVYRQFDLHHVEVFMLHLLDVKGSVLPEALSLSESVGYMMPSIGFFLEEGLRKKLQWRMQQRHQAPSGDAVRDAIEPKGSGENERCEACTRALGTLFSSTGTSCQLCFKRVCWRCSVSREVTKTTKKSANLCAQCHLETKALSALDVAREEINRDRRQDGSASNSSSTSSSSSSSSGRATVCIIGDSPSL